MSQRSRRGLIFIGLVLLPFIVGPLITYEIIKQVVQKYKTNLVILGSSDIYDTDPKYLDKDADQAQLMAQLREDMPGVKPVEIKRALDRILRVRGAVDNIEHLKSLGISVEYICTDVTDYKAVKKAVDACERIVEYYKDNAKKGERLGKMIERLGLDPFEKALKA